MSAAAAFQSHLSTILDKLLTLAVEEIKELVLDYCEELSQEKNQKCDFRERIEADNDPSTFNTSNFFSADVQDVHKIQEQITQTDTKKVAEKEPERPQNDVKHSALKALPFHLQDPINCRFEDVATVSSENPPSINQKDDCSFSPEETEQCFEPQFCSSSPGDRKDQLRDYNLPVQTQSTSYKDIHTSQDHSPNVEFHIKQEEETPDFDTGRNIDNNCDVSQSISFDTYTRCVDIVDPSPLDIPGPILDIPSLSLPDQHINRLISGQENQFRVNFDKPIQKYSCDFCNKTFCYPSDLKHHRRWHTQERTHVCGICGKAFVTRSHLRRHELMHLDVQPSVCHICGYKTSRSAYMKVHMKMHSKK